MRKFVAAVLVSLTMLAGTIAPAKADFGIGDQVIGLMVLGPLLGLNKQQSAPQPTVVVVPSQQQAPAPAPAPAQPQVIVVTPQGVQPTAPVQ